MPPSTPLARPLMSGTKGIDVVAVKRALSRAGFMEWGSFTAVYGLHMRDAVHAFQHSVGLPPAGYGERTHAELLATRLKGSRTAYAWDEYSIHLMHEEYVLLHESPEIRIRRAIITACRYIYAHRMSIGYSQHRPFKLIHIGDPVPSDYDCSGFATESHYAGGARRNPNAMWNGSRYPWTGEGYTGTLLAGGHRVDRDQLKAGDLVFYGFSQRSSGAFPYGSPTHVAVWSGESDMVFSFGSYPLGHYYFRYRHDINAYVTYNVA